MPKKDDYTTLIHSLEVNLCQAKDIEYMTGRVQGSANEKSFEQPDQNTSQPSKGDDNK